MSSHNSRHGISHEYSIYPSDVVHMHSAFMEWLLVQDERRTTAVHKVVQRMLSDPALHDFYVGLLRFWLNTYPRISNHDNMFTDIVRELSARQRLIENTNRFTQDMSMLNGGHDWASQVAATTDKSLITTSAHPSARSWHSVKVTRNHPLYHM